MPGMTWLHEHSFEYLEKYSGLTAYDTPDYEELPQIVGNPGGSPPELVKSPILVGMQEPMLEDRDDLSANLVNQERRGQPSISKQHVKGRVASPKDASRYPVVEIPAARVLRTRPARPSAIEASRGSPRNSERALRPQHKAKITKDPVGKKSRETRQRTRTSSNKPPQRDASTTTRHIEASTLPSPAAPSRRRSTRLVNFRVGVTEEISIDLLKRGAKSRKANMTNSAKPSGITKTTKTKKKQFPSGRRDGKAKNSRPRRA